MKIWVVLAVAACGGRADQTETATGSRPVVATVDAGAPKPPPVKPALHDAPLTLTGDDKFKQLARDVAAQSSTHVLWWGPVRLDGAARRVAFLQSPNLNGVPLYAYLIEADDAVVAVTCQMWGFPRYQGPFDGADPMWGTIQQRDGSEDTPTLDAAPLVVHSQWIHGSFEDVAFTLERGQLVAVSDTWVERENTGNNAPGKRFETTDGAKVFPVGRRPKLATFKGHTAKFAVSAKSNSAADLAAGIHELPR